MSGSTFSSLESYGTSSDSSGSDSINIDNPDGGENRQLAKTSEIARILDSLVSKYHDLREEILHTRVLVRSVQRPPRMSQLPLLSWYAEHNEARFRHYVRVCPVTFWNIVGMIKDHLVFHNNSNNQQMAVDHQLAIFLRRVGHYGNGVSVVDLADWAGVSTGTVENCTRRVALSILSLHDIAMAKPTVQEQISARIWARDSTCPEWDKGYVAVDGTTFPLFEKPGYYGETWFDKDKVYSIKTQVHLTSDLTVQCFHLSILLLGRGYD